MAYIKKEEEEFLYGLYQEVDIPEPFRKNLFNLILDLEDRRKHSNDVAWNVIKERRKTDSNYARKTAK